MSVTYLLWCRECEDEPSPDNAIPFGSPAERGKWAAEHRRGTGHDRWLVLDTDSPTIVPLYLGPDGEREAT
ncbi:hypothetical protein [Pseudonocardia sp. D17]|uniref:hypothetical protein n=1 Tax=Pseudonocardia sp. D17 TaxID=882661 RepID=UPI002B3A06BE|nr:hypothetical protein PSD17_55340 [Pseudonocardia sp. D17]